MFDGANQLHKFFFLSNGVNQRGIISPILFNIYDLSMHLNSSGIEGYLRTAFRNHLCYADDLFLISLLLSGPQEFLHYLQ